MRISLTVKFSLLSAALVLLVLGVPFNLLIYRLGSDREKELVGRDRELAKVLAGLRTPGEELDFDTLSSFVLSADRAETGLVYALEVDGRGSMLRGSINPRLFASLDSDYSMLMRQGRQRVLSQLSEGKIRREGKIKEYTLPVPAGSLRLGFDVMRIAMEIKREQQIGLLILCVGLCLGLFGSIILARRLAAPVQKLASAMEAVAHGDMDHTVQVRSSDELSSLADSFNRMTRALRDLGRVRQLFQRYMSSEVASRILQTKNPLEMAWEERPATVLSLSFHGFSSLARLLGPREIVRLLNDHLPPVLDSILEHKGVVLRLDGDQLLAVWGAPLDCIEPERTAIEAALAVRVAIEKEHRVQAAAGGTGLQICIGICSGRTMAGNVGSAERVSYQVIGGPVELAKHIEMMAQPGEILISEVTFSKVRDLVEAEASAPLILQDMEEAVPLYRVSGVVQQR